MKKIIFVIYILLNSVNNHAYTIDIPEKTTLSQDDLYLKGKVKAINISSDALQLQR